MRWLITCLILIVNLILQSTLFQYIGIMGIKPNTAIIIVASIAFMRGEIDGGITGLIAGFLQDSFFGMFLGLNMFIYMIIGYLCGKFLSGFYKESIIIPTLIALVADFCYGFLFYTISVLMRGYTNFLYFLSTIILPEMVYTAVVSIILYQLLFRINMWYDERYGYKRKVFNLK